MNRPDYLSLSDLVKLIDRPAQDRCVDMLAAHGKLFLTTPGSTYNHQTWPGGYWDHVCEVMNIALILFPAFKATGRSMPFTLSDALLALFMHDMEKPWKYVHDAEGKIAINPEYEDKESQHALRMSRAKEFELYLTEDQQNAIRYSEGEDRRTSETKMTPLAGFVHLCDHASARVFRDYPLLDDDPWSGKRPSTKE